MTIEQKYDQLFLLINKMRSAHWQNKKYGSKSASLKENKIGLEIDKLLREENQLRYSLQKELKS